LANNKIPNHNEWDEKSSYIETWVQHMRNILEFLTRHSYPSQIEQKDIKKYENDLTLYEMNKLEIYQVNGEHKINCINQNGKQEKVDVQVLIDRASREMSHITMLRTHNPQKKIWDFAAVTDWINKQLICVFHNGVLRTLSVEKDYAEFFKKLCSENEILIKSHVSDLEKYNKDNANEKKILLTPKPSKQELSESQKLANREKELNSRKLVLDEAQAIFKKKEIEVKKSSADLARRENKLKKAQEEFENKTL
jgi:hypothetical protein